MPPATESGGTSDPLDVDNVSAWIRNASFLNLRAPFVEIEAPLNWNPYPRVHFFAKEVQAVAPIRSNRTTPVRAALLTPLPPPQVLQVSSGIPWLLVSRFNHIAELMRH